MIDAPFCFDTGTWGFIFSQDFQGVDITFSLPVAYSAVHYILSCAVCAPYFFFSLSRLKQHLVMLAAISRHMWIKYLNSGVLTALIQYDILHFQGEIIS